MRAYSDIGEYRALVEEADFSQAGPSVFYSRGLLGGNRRLAEAYAEAYGGGTIETTEIGAALDSQRLFGEDSVFFESILHPDQRQVPWSPREAEEVWDAASRRFAECARGAVVAFLDPAQLDTTFFEVELPALLTNDHVTAINGVSRTMLLELVEERLALLNAADQTTEPALLQALRAVHDAVGHSPLQITYEPQGDHSIEP